MSIPVSVDPLGTLGHTNELPWLQPVLTDWGSLEQGLVVTNDSTQYFNSNSATWKMFDADTNSYWCTKDWPAVNNALFATATPIKVLSLVFSARYNSAQNASVWSFYARINNDWMKLCAGDSYTDGLKKEYIVANPVFSNEYRLEMTAGHGSSFTSHAYCKDLKLNAVYKP